MKRVLLTSLTLAVLFSVGFTPAIAQDMNVGFKAGLSMAKLMGDDLDDLDGRTGLVFGADMNLAFSPNMSFQPGLFYVNKGAKDSDSETVEGVKVDVESTIKLDYLEVPLLLRFSPEMDSSVRPYLLVGPAVAFKMSSKVHVKVTASGQGMSISAEEEEDLEDVKSLDIGAVIGAGLEIPMGSMAFALEARYTLGLTTIDDSSNAEDIKNGAFMIMAGVRF